MSKRKEKSKRIPQFILLFSILIISASIIGLAFEAGKAWEVTIVDLYHDVVTTPYRQFFDGRNVKTSGLVWYAPTYTTLRWRNVFFPLAPDNYQYYMILENVDPIALAPRRLNVLCTALPVCERMSTVQVEGIIHYSLIDNVWQPYLLVSKI